MHKKPASRESLEWKMSSSCSDVDPNVMSAPDPAEAKKICVGCEYLSRCLEFAIAHPDDNDVKGHVWGGSTEKERQLIINHRNSQPENIYKGNISF